MTLGEKIVSLRKKQKLSQEDLAEYLGVTRQTISNWELNETTPNISEAKELSKIFNISLDELVENDIKSILEDKISNTEKLAGVILKLLKVAGIIFLIMLAIEVVIFFIFGINSIIKRQEGVTEVNLNCTLNEEKYTYKVEYDDKYIIRAAGGSAYIVDNVGTEDFNNALDLLNAIEKYFKDNSGFCIQE